MNNQDGPIKIPSDIKPGLYILRTELLSLHGNGQTRNPGLKGLPQFYTHCFNVQITGEGNATPEGVKFPGGYPKNDAGVGFILAGNKARYSSYVSCCLSYSTQFHIKQFGINEEELAHPRPTRLQRPLRYTTRRTTNTYTQPNLLFPCRLWSKVYISPSKNECVVG